MANRISKLLSILLVACMVIGMVPAAVLAASTPDVIYLKPNDNWLADGARFAAYFYGNGDTWVDCTDPDGDGIYEAAVPSGFTSVIFCRMNPADSANNWDNKWNQTADLALPTDGTNCYNVEGWDAGNGSWSTFVKQEYYLVGFINGANYGYEEDYQNMGDYKFVNGKLVVTFTSDSYVLVKTTGNATWYLAESYCTDTSCTLVSDGTEKMFVPGNSEVTFTLTVNDEDSVTLSYTAKSLSCSHSYTSKVTTAATCTKEGVKTYTCSKCGDSYTESIAAKGHSYQDGACTVCGAYDPNYTVTDTGFVLVTDASAITAGGKFVIVALVDGSYKAMDTTLSSGKFAGMDVSVSNRIVTGDSLPVWTIESVSGGVALSVDGAYLNYNSSTNFKFADTAYAWSVAAGESGFVFTSTATTRGIYYGISAGKFGAYASATSSYVFELLVFKYQVGSQGCSHSYTSKVTTAATCTKDGVTTYTCSLCGDSYTESIAAIGHNYVDGSCANCGEAAPVVDYYLFGYINGADYGVGDDLANMGSYKFVDGKLTVKFTADSYVAVKTTGNAAFYMTNGYVGAATSATLYKFTDPNAVSADKLLVPGGQTVNFTLTENWDGNLLISYTVDTADCVHTSHDADGICTTCGAAVEHTYSDGCCTVCGSIDPNYDFFDYYLFGYINGANYGCEEDAANLGSYKFVNGKLTVTFDSDSYVGIKEVYPNAKYGNEVMGWYMTDGWLGENVTSATLYSSEVLGENANKLLIPAGVTAVLEMVKNDDGTISVTCSMIAGSDVTGFVQVTDISAITSGGKFVIVALVDGTYKAMTTSLSSGKFVAVDVTVTNGVVTGAELPIWSIESVSGGIALSVDGSYLNYNTSTNFKFADTAYVWTVAAGDSGFIFDSAATTRGIYYQISSTKFGAYSTSYASSASYVSNLMVFKYQVGDAGCSHSYISKEITAPTCLGTGSRSHTCSLCGYSYIEEIPATGHDYELTVVAPTCENNGYTIHACKNCSYSYNDTAVNPIGHNYSSVVTAPTCTEKGYTTYTCSNCGNVYTWNETPATGHTYVSGKCTGCGEADPNYSVDYYLFGFINGANYGCEDDYATLGDYKFVNGKLTAVFSQDSYVGVKTSDNSTWYMAMAYTSDTTVTLYSTDKGSAEKMFVPGNAEITFTLVVNEDGTLTLSYTAESLECSHSYTSKVTTAATCDKAGVKTYTCSKCGDSYTESISALGHSYTSKVTTAATCTTAGVKTYTCSNCGGSYTESIAATGHNYVSGNCTVCGAYDPNYTVTDTGFVLVTDASAITSGGKFVIVALVDGTYKAMGTTLSSGKFASVDVSVSNRIVTGSSLPVWTVEKVSGGIALSVDGSYLNYNTSTNFKFADTAYTWTVTAGDSGFILDSSATTRGIYYQISSAKFGAYSTTYVNSASYVSNLLIFKYQVGTQGCSHSYTSKVTTAATCDKAGVRTYTCSLCGSSYTESIAAIGHSYTSKVTTAATCTTAGVKTYTCSNCGDSYTESIAALGHSYSNGSCTVCGAADPNAGTGTADYYLIGYINGANYGCEEDWANLGQYKFVGGKLTATFNQDSYVFIKTGDNNNWYMFQSYCSGTSGKLYNTSTGSAEKMFVPGGVTVSFNLVENADGSLTLSYTTGSASVVTPTLTLKNPTLAFEDEILYNVYFTVDNMASVVEMGMVTFATRDANGTVANALEVIPGYVANNDGTYTVHSNGIPAKMLGDALYFKVYAKLTNGTYVYTGVVGYHAVAYANSVLNNSASSAKAKSLVVAMLNYGAAAQTNFGYKTDALMNASLTSAQKALVSAYSESMIAAVPSVSSTKAGSFVMNGGYSDIHPTVSFEGAFSINYYFTPKYTPSNGLTFYYWNLSDFNANSVLKTTNATGSVKITNATNGVYTTAIEGIAAKAIDEPVFIAAVYTNGGTSYYTPVIGYSLGAYCKNIAANGNAFGAATAVYGYYAKAYFAN